MDAVEIFLSCVVGFSVSVSVILGYIEERTRNSSDGGGGTTEQLTPEQFQKDGFFDDDLDWEGVDRSELERVFGEALVFVSSECITGYGDDDDDRIHQDLKMELYGLSKIALEGPCYKSRPVAFKLSARSKWNAWRKLGNMSRDTAMETYIDILSKAIPGWQGRPLA